VREKGVQNGKAKGKRRRALGRSNSAPVKNQFSKKRVTLSLDNPFG
jgi:hypothetical protein